MKSVETVRCGVTGRASALLAAALLAAAVLLAPEEIRAQAAGDDQRPGVGVFPFENGGSFGPEAEDLELLTVGLQQMLLGDLARNSNLRIVERAQLRQILEEQDLGASGRVEPGTAAAIGRLVGARYMVTGTFVDNFGAFQMDVRIFDGETSEILAAEFVRGPRTELFDMIFEMSQKITAAAQLPPLDREVREARSSRQVPAEAILLYSRAQTYQDFGEHDRAAAVYRQIIQEFPQMVEAEEALRQIPNG